MVDKTPVMWGNRRVLHPDDAHGLDIDAARYEFGEKMPRGAAEARAYDEYVKERRLDAAAHHLAGSKGAMAAGDMEAAKKHGALYSAHMQKLGLNPVDAVPSEIQQRLQKLTGVYRFKPHNGDLLTLDPEPAALAKGEVVDLNAPQPTGKKFRRNAEVHDARAMFNDKQSYDRVVRGPPAVGRKVATGIGTAADRYDYSHHLPEADRQAGAQLFISHKLGNHDDFMLGHILQGGKEIAKDFAYPSLTDQPHGGTTNPHIGAALKQHADWVKYQRALKQG